MFLQTFLPRILPCLPQWSRLQWGLIAGSFYLHDESYLTPQGHNYWKGIVVKHDVRKGEYSPMFVDLPYLERRYSK